VAGWVEGLRDADRLTCRELSIGTSKKMMTTTEGIDKSILRFIFSVEKANNLPLLFPITIPSIDNHQMKASRIREYPAWTFNALAKDWV